MPVDMIMVTVERTKAAKLFQMSWHNILTAGKHLCQRRSGGKVIMGLWRVAGLFFRLFSFLGGVAQENQLDLCHTHTHHKTLTQSLSQVHCSLQ